MKTIKFKGIQFSVDIELKQSMTIIEGNAATGKTLLYNTIYKQLAFNKNSDFICIDYNDIIKLNDVYIADKIDKANNKIIIIDNANNVLKSKKILNAIQNDMRNYYILLGRSLPVYSSLSSLAEILITNNTISIKYLFED